MHTNKPDHLQGLTEEQIANHVGGINATAEAAALPLPGALGAAFAGLSRTVCGLSVRPPVAMDFAILQKLNSPLMQQMAEAGKPVELRQKTEFTDQDGYDMVFQFTRPVDQAEAQIGMGVDSFRKAARCEIGERMNPFTIAWIIEAIGALFAESYLTALRYKDGDADPGKVFPVPPASRTASAGGSTTSACS